MNGSMDYGSWRDTTDYGGRAAVGEPPGEPTRLLCTVEAPGGLKLHVCAVRVTDAPNDYQSAFDECDVEELENVNNLDSDGPYETTTIPGYEGDWVVYAHPFVQ